MARSQRTALIGLDAERRPFFAAWRFPSPETRGAVMLGQANADGSGLRYVPIRGVRGGPLRDCGAFCVSRSGRTCWLTDSVPDGDRVVCLDATGSVRAQWRLPRYGLDDTIGMTAVGDDTVYTTDGQQIRRFAVGRAEVESWLQKADLIDGSGWAWLLAYELNSDWRLEGRPVGRPLLPPVVLGRSSDRACYRLAAYEPGTGLDLLRITGPWRARTSYTHRAVIRFDEQGRRGVLLKTGSLRGPWRGRLAVGAALATGADGTVWMEGGEPGADGSYYVLRVAPAQRRSMLSRHWRQDNGTQR